MNNISVMGAGAWGTALGAMLASNGTDVLIYAREKDAVDSINATNINKPFLDGIKLPKTLTATDNVEDVLKSKVILITTPSQFFRGQLRQLSKHEVPADTIFVICSKGIENESLSLMSFIFEEFFKNDYAILSGPTFAAEVAEGVATSASVASHDIMVAEKLEKIFNRDKFIIHVNNDVIGSQICGAMKNVIAIACGIVRGLGQGENTRAAILTRGFHEIMKMNLEMGGRMETLLEVCGIGDLLLTCSSEQSRNFSFGMGLGQKKSEEEIMQGKKSVVEGVATSKSVLNLAHNLDLSMPLCEKIYEIVEGLAPPEDILQLV